MREDKDFYYTDETQREENEKVWDGMHRSSFTYKESLERNDSKLTEILEKEVESKVRIHAFIQLEKIKEFTSQYHALLVGYELKVHTWAWTGDTHLLINGIPWSNGSLEEKMTSQKDDDYGTYLTQEYAMLHDLFNFLDKLLKDNSGGGCSYVKDFSWAEHLDGYNLN